MNNKWFVIAGVFILIIAFNMLSFSGQEITAESSSLKYKDLKAGTGAVSKPGEIAVIHFIGWLSDNGKKGKEFFNSYDSGKPVAFKLGSKKVVQGWNVGVSGMKAGGKRRLMVPSELGYGPKGVDGLVPPNADLIFDIELLEVK